MYNIEIINIEYNTKYLLSIRNKFTFLTGDTATGKSTIITFIREWIATRESNIARNTKIISPINIEAPYGFNEINHRENTLFVFDESLAPGIRKNKSIFINSNNYFLIIDREMIDLPYGVYDILKLDSTFENGYTINRTVPLYNMVEEYVTPNLIITEDESSGYKFYNRLLSVPCVSAKGKTRIMKKVGIEVLRHNKTVLLIVDEVGFGYEFSKLVELCSTKPMKNKQVYIWLPKSFEYVLLNSGMFIGIDDFLKDPYDSWDLSKYNTVEQYITSVLNNKMKEKFGVSYSKSMDITEYFKGYTLMIFKNNFLYFEKLLK